MASERSVRPALPSDVPALLGLIRELATYERAPAEVVATEELLHSALFGPQPVAYAHVAVDSDEVAGFALWFISFSTWLARPGIYLEDLFVTPSARRRGHGRALLQELGRIAVEREYGRLEWAVLDWNVDAQAFYRSLGAQPMDEWTTWRVTGNELRVLGRPNQT